MSTTHFLFYGRLNDFLQNNQKEKNIPVNFKGRQTIKHLAESLGVPHPEIGRIQVNGREEAGNFIPQDQDHVEIYPIENGCPIDPRFMLDCHLGRLTAHLRMLGFDCLYENDFEDAEMANLIEHDERILLTRDRRLLMRNAVRFGYCLRSLDPLDQLTEVMQHFELKNKIQPFHRCLRCNHLLEPVEKEFILDRLQPLTRQYFNDFHICPNCGQIYWKGSHYDQMVETIENLR